MFSDVFCNGKPKCSNIFLLLGRLIPQGFIRLAGLIRYDGTGYSFGDFDIPFTVLTVLIVNHLVITFL